MNRNTALIRRTVVTPPAANAADLIANLDGIEPIKIEADKRGVIVDLASCADYRHLCGIYKIKPGDHRWSHRDRYPHRRYDASTKDSGVVLRHLCWPYLACWADATGERTLVEEAS